MMRPTRGSKGDQVTISKPKKLLLHVGLSKCGSTAVQTAIAANSERLAARHGLCVPRATTSDRLPGHHIGLSKAIIRDDAAAYRDALARILAEAEGFEGVVVSSEGLSRLGGHRLVADLLSTFETVEILVLIRPHAERLPSAFSQQIKNGYAALAADSPDLFSAWKRSLVDRKDHDYETAVLAYLGSENVTTLRVGYFGSGSSQRDISRALTAFLGIDDLDAPDRGHNVNPSLSVDGLKFKLALNRLFPKTDLQSVTQILVSSPLATAGDKVNWHDEHTARFSEKHYRQAVEALDMAAREDPRLVLDEWLRERPAPPPSTTPSEVLKHPLSPETYRSLALTLDRQGIPLTDLLEQQVCSVERGHWPAIELQRRVSHLKARLQESEQ
jgi:hypothetical protein